MSENFGEFVEKFIEQKVNEILSKREIPSDVEYIQTDNIAEVIEKLLIVNIRVWMLEDSVKFAETDTDIADIKRRQDIVVKQKRPRLVQALNALLEDAVTNSKSLVEDSVKIYKGFKE